MVYALRDTARLPFDSIPGWQPLPWSTDELFPTPREPTAAAQGTPTPLPGFADTAPQTAPLASQLWVDDTQVGGQAHARPETAPGVQLPATLQIPVGHLSPAQKHMIADHLREMGQTFISGIMYETEQHRVAGALLREISQALADQATSEMDHLFASVEQKYWAGI